MHKHVVRDGEQVPLHRGVQRHHHLEAPHVPRVAGVFQTVLVALQEELEEESGRKRSGNALQIFDLQPLPGYHIKSGWDRINQRSILWKINAGCHLDV